MRVRSKQNYLSIANIGCKHIDLLYTLSMHRPALVIVSVECTKMKCAIIALILVFSINEANAVVYCAAGLYHAGCVRRPVGTAVVAPRPVAGAVVAPRRCAIVNGVRVCR